MFGTSADNNSLNPILDLKPRGSFKAFRQNYLNGFKGPFGIDGFKASFRVDGFKASLRIDGSIAFSLASKIALVLCGFKDSFGIDSLQRLLWYRMSTPMFFSLLILDVSTNV